MSLTAVPAVIALPTVTAPQHRPHPVRPSVQTLVVATQAMAARAAGAQAPGVHPFALLGASWQRSALVGGDRVQVRVEQRGTWSAWTALEPNDAAPDRGSADDRAAQRAHLQAATVVTEPLWVGRATGVQTRVVHADGTPSATPPEVRLTAVDPGMSDADVSVGATSTLGGAAAYAAQLQPAIYTRAQWGADESLRQNQCPSGPDYSDTIKIGFVHHTDTSNDYSSSDVPSIIRSIYAYHVKGNGWCDIGYNFLVDRFGRTWEGRYGGMTRPVIGAHTGGFNTDSFGVAAIGTFTSTVPPSAMISAYQKLFAWKLGLHFRDPNATDYLVSAGGGTDKWPTGQSVQFNVVSGHRNAGNTSCPGDALYARLGTIRSGARALMGPIGRPTTDFTGDRHSDVSVWRPSSGRWYVKGVASVQWGAPGDIAVPADYDGERTTDIAVWRPSNGRWYVRGTPSTAYGTSGDVPVPADYTGDGRADLAVWRPSVGMWYVQGRRPVQWGLPTDIPVPADYNGDGATDIAVWRPSSGTWYVKGQQPRQWGVATDVPVPADYNGDGKADIGTWRAANQGWYVPGRPTVRWGTQGDVPVVANYNGVLLADVAVYRPSNNKWYVRGTPAVAWGTAGDVALPAPYAITRERKVTP